MKKRAEALAAIAVESGAEAVMIGGAPFLMSALERALQSRGVQPLYAFSRREVVEQGGIKTSVFIHAGFVPA